MVGMVIASLIVPTWKIGLSKKPARKAKGKGKGKSAPAHALYNLAEDPGETKDVSFTLTAPELGCWSADGKWVVEPGRFELVIAPDAASGQMVGFSLEP